MSKFIFSKKGFIGPIGDDLPSLVPIVVALVLFFTIFALTLNTFNSKNEYIGKQMEMTSVAREIKGDSLILGIDQFFTKCNSVRLKNFPYNFMVGIYFSESDLRASIADFRAVSAAPGMGVENGPDVGFVNVPTDAGQKGYYCNYSRVGASKFVGKEKTYLMRYYPVALQYPVKTARGDSQYIIIPAIMAMVVWE